MAEIIIKKRRISEKSLANLRPFKKGENGGSHGRPHKADCLLDCIKEELDKPSLASGLTNDQLIAAMLVAQATKGNLKAIELVMSYTIAKPTASVDVTTKGKPLQTFIFQMPDGTKKTAGELAHGNSDKT